MIETANSAYTTSTGTHDNPVAQPTIGAAPVQPFRVLISGGSGMIGAALISAWMRDSVRILRLVRNPTPHSTTAPHAENGSKVENIVWDPSSPQPFSDPAVLGEVDAAVHLSGASVADRRWTETYKREIVSSRVGSTRALVSALAALRRPPRVLVCASAIGIYGDRGDEILTEDSPPGAGFLAATCVAWEAAAHAAEDAGIRVVQVRFGVVLSPRGGALAKLLPLFRLGLGGKLGNGREWMSWLTLCDAVGIVRYSIGNQAIGGAVNAVAPAPLTNAQFTRALGAALGRPALLPAPAFALRLAFGAMADEALLASARVVPARLVKTGYQFTDPEIAPALRGLLS